MSAYEELVRLAPRQLIRSCKLPSLGVHRNKSFCYSVDRLVTDMFDERYRLLALVFHTYICRVPMLPKFIQGTASPCGACAVATASQTAAVAGLMAVHAHRAGSLDLIASNPLLRNLLTTADAAEPAARKILVRRALLSSPSMVNKYLLPAASSGCMFCSGCVKCRKQRCGPAFREKDEDAYRAAAAKLRIDWAPVYDQVFGSGQLSTVSESLKMFEDVIAERAGNAAAVLDAYVAGNTLIRRMVALLARHGYKLMTVNIHNYLDTFRHKLGQYDHVVYIGNIRSFGKSLLTSFINRQTTVAVYSYGASDPEEVRALAEAYEVPLFEIDWKSLLRIV